MRITDRCVGCAQCIPYCPHEAISITESRKAIIDEQKCTECFVCYRAYVCPVDAIEESKLSWPRTLRLAFGSVLRVHEETGIPGRGTEEMKTNDVTGRFKPGEVGFSVDIGRPGLGTTFVDVEKVTTAMAEVGVEFEPMNPVTFLMKDKRKGLLRDDIKRELIHSCVAEFKTNVENTPKVINALQEVAKRIDTVFSVGCCSVTKPDGSTQVKAILDQIGIQCRPNGKTNIGLGRPLFHQEVR